MQDLRFLEIDNRDMRILRPASYMIKKALVSKKLFQRRVGFTLIEILIVLCLLAIISTVIITQLRVSQHDAQLNTLKTNLQRLQKAIQLYYYQHGFTFPGVKDKDGKDINNAVDAEESFVLQLTQFTDSLGRVKDSKDETHNLGPYIRSNRLPINSFNQLYTVKCDITTTDIALRNSDGTTGWKFYIKTGILIPNDGEHDDLFVTSDNSAPHE